MIRGASSKGFFAGYKPDLVATKWTDANKRELWIACLQCKVKKR